MHYCECCEICSVKSALVRQLKGGKDKIRVFILHYSEISREEVTGWEGV